MATEAAPIWAKWQGSSIDNDKEIAKLSDKFRKIAKDKPLKQSKKDKEAKKDPVYDAKDGGDEKISEKEFTKTFSKAMKIPVADANLLFKAGTHAGA